MTPDFNIATITHPSYNARLLNWEKWRLTAESGDAFINRYLKKFSKRENTADFRDRESITYCPAFAKGALNDIKNAIFRRAVDITRKGGSASYITAVAGQDGGVDLAGSSMNSFVGRKLLPELLSMSSVGVYIDMPALNGPTLIDKGSARPYIYMYQAEQVRAWTERPGDLTSLIAVLLRDCVYTTDETTGLINGTAEVYRHLYINEFGTVTIDFYDSGSKKQDSITLKISKIPFVIFDIGDSIIADVANYQIALLNLESSDIFYAMKANFPFYTEQFDSRSESLYLQASNANQETNEVKVGTAVGRKYPIGTERPAFIHPSSEPLKASMEKGEQIKRDIRALVNLAVSNLSSKMASAESKSLDNQSLEDGLSYIALELEHGERQIAEIWSLYENNKEISTVIYPTDYTLKTDEDKQNEAEKLEQALTKLPSKTYQKQMAKQIAYLRVGTKVSNETLDTINQEIDAAEVIISDPDVIASDLENGLVSVELASKMRGYPKGQVEKAKKDHAERLARIAISQTAGMAAESRGVNDLGADPKAASKEKQVSRDTTQDPTVTDKTRGEGQ